MLKLARIFADGVILQRGTPFRVWGWADGNVRLSLFAADGRTVLRQTECEVCDKSGRFEGEFEEVSDTRGV